MSRLSGGADAGEMKATSLVTCGRAIKEADTERWSLIDVFDAIKPNGLPFNSVPFYVYAAISRRGATGEFYIGIIAPNGDLLSRTVATVGGADEAQFAVPIPSVPFSVAGEHVVRLFIAGRVLMERSLLVQTALPPTGE